MEEAVFNDCRALIKNFAEKGRPRFASFCAEWGNLSFQHIFTNQSTYIQVQQTTACAFYLGKRIAGNLSVTRDNAYNFAECASEQTKLLYRIGGLYLLYAVYFKQPLNQYTKIEVSLDLWHEIKHLVTSLLPADQPAYDEARYVFWKLFKSQAFRFTANDFCVGLEALVDYYDLDSTRSHSLGQVSEGVGRLLEKHTNFNSLKQTTPALVALEKGYNEMKSELIKLHQLDGKLLPPTNIFHNIRESFEKIDTIIDETDNPKESGMSRSNRRRKIKDKAYGGDGVAKKQADSVSMNEAEQKTSEQPREQPHKQTKKYAKICRMSARTIFANKLPDDYDDESNSDGGDSDESTQSTKEQFMANETPVNKNIAAESVDQAESKSTVDDSGSE